MPSHSTTVRPIAFILFGTSDKFAPARHFSDMVEPRGGIVHNHSAALGNVMRKTIDHAGVRSHCLRARIGILELIQALDPLFVQRRNICAIETPIDGDIAAFKPFSGVNAAAPGPHYPSVHRLCLSVSFAYMPNRCATIFSSSPSK